MNILFDVKVKESGAHEMGHTTQPWFCLVLSLEKYSYFEHAVQFLFEHVLFWNPFVGPHLQWRIVIEGGSSALVGMFQTRI